MKKGIPSSVSAREPRVAPPEVEAAVKAVMRGDSATGLGVLRPLAEEGDVDAQLALGFLYAHGEGVAQNGKRAASWYLKAAMQGEAEAQHHLGDMYYLGQGVPQDYERAARWFLKAAKQGVMDAQLTLGEMFHDGQGVPQDYEQAARWFSKAAKQGESDAQRSLGEMFYNGQGVPQDYEQAARWFSKAAEQGDPEAQFRLAAMYYDGKGVAQDYAEAARWYSKLAKWECIGSAEMGQTGLLVKLDDGDRNCGWIYRFWANPGRPWGGIVPPAPDLAPGLALGSRPRVALSSAQAPSL